MISVTATEFQQRTGYYFELADKGEEVEIRKMKPKGQIFKLVRVIKPEKKTSQSLIEQLEEYMSNEHVENAIRFQNRVRN